MKSAIALVAALLVVSVYSEETLETNEGLLTAEQIESLLEQAKEESSVEDDCNDQTLLSCLGIDHKSCEAFNAEIVSECTLPMAREILSSNGEIAENLELEHAKCTLELGENKYQVPPKRYLNCMPAGTYEQPELINDWLKNR